MPSNSRALECSPYQHLRRVWHQRLTLCRMQLLSGVHFQTCSCVSLWASRTARTRNRRHGAVPPRIFTPCWRACPPTIECWKVARTNICDEVDTSGRRFVVSSCRPGCVCGSVLAYRCDRRNRAGGAAVSPQRAAHLGCSLPKARQQAGEDKHREAWRHTVANLFCWLARTPSKSRVFKSSPYQHLRRVWHCRQTFLRMQLPPGMHLRARKCASL